LLASVDAIRKMLDALEKAGTEGADDFSTVIGTLERLLTSASNTPVATPQPSSIVSLPPASSIVVPVPPPFTIAPAPVVTPPSTPAYNATTIMFEPSPVVNPPSNPSIKPPSNPNIELSEPKVTAVSDTALRVDVRLLDKLMTLVGELVLARNQIMQFSTEQEDPAFLSNVQRLNLLTTELQTNVMKTRMQPIGNMWSKFPRVVRDLAIACGKQVRLEMEGQETELDKTIVEAIRDPLTHIVRNAVDHGIETPDLRTANGKSAEGHLKLQAFHEGGKVIIMIVDDGRGIDPVRVRDKAIATQLITVDQAQRMTQQELIELIFLPGFSTTDKVTNFSGRGVGMDVVRTNVERIGGSVEIDSKLGQGTTLRMKIPLTLAIIPALTISCGGDRYAIPQVSLLELVRLDGEQAKNGIEYIHGAAVYRLRGNLLPLVYLNRELRVSDDYLGVDGEISIVVLQAEERPFGLIVDAIHDTEEIVVKPLQKQIKSIPIFAGATIMGDGKVALILDVLGLAQRANVLASVRDRTVAEKASTTNVTPKETVLLFTTRGGDRLAVPLGNVARLEEFPLSMLERVGDHYLVQYRGQILPLLDVAKALGKTKTKKRRKTTKRTKQKASLVQVVVYTKHDQVIG
jgi:two-component system chemotaxis sensor kinase CheA